MIVVFEGIDGSGKSTLIRRTAEKLSERGAKVQPYTFYNTGFLDKNWLLYYRVFKERAHEVGSAIIANDFHWLMKTEVYPFVESGGIALFDRYYYTAIARDTVRGALAEQNEQYRDAPSPDLVFFLDASPLDTVARKSEDELGFFECGLDIGHMKNLEERYRMYQEGRIEKLTEKFVEFQEKVYQEYKEINYKTEVVTVDATRGEKDCWKQIEYALAKYIPKV